MMWHVIVATERTDERGRINPEAIIQMWDVGLLELGAIAPVLLEISRTNAAVEFIGIYKIGDKRA